MIKKATKNIVQTYTIYNLFIITHLNYENIIYNAGFNASFQQNLKKIQTLQ